MFLSKHKNGYYYIYYGEPITGKRKSISTGSKFKSEANKFLSEFRTEIKRRKEKQLFDISLKDFRFEYLKYSESIHSPKTSKAYKTSFGFLIKYFGNTKLTDISKSKLMDYFQKRIREASIYQARKDLINLSSAFNWAIEKRYLNVNPCSGIKRFKIPEKQPLFFSEAEFQTLLRNIDEPDIKDLVLFAVNTGLRQMELLTLEWNQINFKEGYLILDNRNHLTKSKKVRTIPLNAACLQVLTRRQIDSQEELIFTFKGKQFKQQFLSKKFKRYVNKSGLNSKLNFHSLRHTFASLLVQKGTPIYVVKELLGHSTIAVTEKYSHLRSDDLRASINLLNIEN